KEKSMSPFNNTIPFRRTVLVTVLAAGVCLTAIAQEAPQASAASEAPMRAWTSINGNIVEGAFVKEENGKVFLKRPDGSIVATTRAKLSPNDLLWIDARLNPEKVAKTESFAKATQLEINKMEGHKKVRRLILHTYTKLTNNDRDDKMLAFLIRDAFSMYGWQYIGADCYLTKSGKKGKIKEMQFMPQEPVPLREAVQMTRDKFTLALPDPVIVKEISEDGDTFWEVQGAPPYVSRILLLVDPGTQNIKRFDFTFPPPGKAATR
ncbi:MAG: hypothetical protein PHG74_14690, partial [Kiritimatiellae bacterium]|nr:hypothetical protein [Kiritimatiellia bacterium]